ncbi:hypothetical protein [Mycobacterium sp.]
MRDLEVTGDDSGVYGDHPPLVDENDSLAKMHHVAYVADRIT